jgi:SAM-dependent methyltransferase
VQHLPLEASSFDACRVSRVLLHVAAPEVVLHELVRVVRKKSPVVAIEPDFETLIMAHPERETARTIRNCFCDSFENGTVGRWLPVLFRRLGLRNVRYEPFTIPLTAEFLIESFRIGNAVQEAEKKQLISPAKGHSFLTKLYEAGQRGDFFCCGHDISGKRVQGIGESRPLHNRVCFGKPEVITEWMIRREAIVTEAISRRARICWATSLSYVEELWFSNECGNRFRYIAYHFHVLHAPLPSAVRS